MMYDLKFMIFAVLDVISYCQNKKVAKPLSKTQQA